MKEEQENYDREVEKTLASLDGLRPAAPAPFFYTRLTGKLSRRTAAEWAFPLIWKAAIVVLLLINGFTVYMLTRGETQESPLETLSAEYFDGTDELYTLDYFQE